MGGRAEWRCPVTVCLAPGFKVVWSDNYQTYDQIIMKLFTGLNVQILVQDDDWDNLQKGKGV